MKHPRSQNMTREHQKLSQSFTSPIKNKPISKLLRLESGSTLSPNAGQKQGAEGTKIPRQSPRTPYVFLHF